MKNLVIGYGNVGRLVAQELVNAGEQVTIGRHAVVGETEGLNSVGIDLLDPTSVTQAVSGHDVVFVTTGLPYKRSLWFAQWPPIIDNVIAACKQANAKLVFIDNIYLYGPAPLHNPITEDHPRSPISEKGKLRLQLVQKLETAMREGLNVLIVRCADFYGPNVASSGLTMAINASAKGKSGFFIGDETVPHSYSYVPDIAKATVLLAMATDTYNQTWHTPTDEAITGVDVKRLVGAAAGARVRWFSLRPGSIALIGLFVPILGEIREMMYQFENDYVFDSSKFQRRFPEFVVTRYVDGIAATVAASREQ